MASYLAIFFSLACILLLLIILIRFKKLFSTEKIIEKTQIYMEKMVKDLNKNAKIDMDLMNEASARMRALIAESEQKIVYYNEATERLRNMIAEVERLSDKNIEPSIPNQRLQISRITSGYEENKNVSSLKTVSQLNKEIVAERYKSNKISPDDSFTVVNNQPSLFDSDDSGLILKDETKITSDGAAYKEVPLIVSNIYEDKPVFKESEVAKLQVSDKQSMVSKVQEYLNQGLSVEQIAAELSCSVTEVQLIIDIN